MAWVTIIAIFAFVLGIAFWLGQESKAIKPIVFTHTPHPTYTPYPTYTSNPAYTLSPSIRPTREVSKIGEHLFANGCISKDIWTPYGTRKNLPLKGQCWDLSSQGLFVHETTLVISVDPKIVREAAAIGTLFESGTQIDIEFNVKELLQISSEDYFIVVGIGIIPWRQGIKTDFLYPTEKPDNFYVLIYTDSPDEPWQLKIGTSIFDPNLMAIKALKQDTPVQVSIDLQAGYFTVNIEGTPLNLNPFTTSSSEYWFWIGYYRKPLDKSKIEVEIQIRRTRKK